MTQTPTLSILIACHNLAGHLGACLDSITPQLRAGVDIVLYDDASTDGTPAIAAGHAAQLGGAMRVIAGNENVGVGSARNRLIAAARGDFIWFFDGDDIMAPGAVDAVRRICAGSAPDMLCFDYVTFADGTAPDWHTPARTSWRGPARQVIRDPAQAAMAVIDSGNLHLWSRVLRRSLFSPDIRFADGARVYEDAAIVPVLAATADGALHLPVPLVAYRQRAGSVLGSQSWRDGPAFYAAMDQMIAGLRRACQPMPRALRDSIGSFVAKQQRGLVMAVINRAPRAQRPALCLALYRAFRACAGLTTGAAIAMRHRRAGLHAAGEVAVTLVPLAVLCRTVWRGAVASSGPQATLAGNQPSSRTVDSASAEE